MYLLTSTHVYLLRSAYIAWRTCTRPYATKVEHIVTTMTARREKTCERSALARKLDAASLRSSCSGGRPPRRCESHQSGARRTSSRRRRVGLTGLALSSIAPARRWTVGSSFRWCRAWLALAAQIGMSGMWTPSPAKGECTPCARCACRRRVSTRSRRPLRHPASRLGSSRAPDPPARWPHSR